MFFDVELVIIEHVKTVIKLSKPKTITQQPNKKPADCILQ